MKRVPLAHALSLIAGCTDRFITANGVKLHLVQAGPADGPLVLLLHGFPEYSYSWRFQLTALADRYRVVAPDLRGYNLSDKPRRGYDVTTLVSDVRELSFTLGAR